MVDWRRRAVLVASIAALTLQGCYKATFVQPSVAPGPQVEKWTDHYLFGLIGHEELDVRLLCPGELAVVRTGGNVATDLVTLVTLGIYAPRKVYVSCAGSAASPAVPGPSSPPAPPPYLPAPPPAGTDSTTPAPPPAPSAAITLSPSGLALHADGRQVQR